MKKHRGELTVVGLALAALALVGAGVWALVSAMSVGLLRGWFVASLVALPLVGWVGWRVGTGSARAHLSGLDKGIGAVMGAASKTADLRVSTVGRARQAVLGAPAATATPVFRLPDPEIRHVVAVSDEVVDL